VLFQSYLKILRYKFFVDFSKIGGYENEAERAVIVFVEDNCRRENRK
jgi:hypothetical protein